MALLPGSAAAGRATKYHDHHVGFFCETPLDGGFAAVNIDSSSAFGDFASASVWRDPAIPYEDAPAISGFAETVSITQGTIETSFSATFDVFDGDGNPLGTADLEATMTPVGDPQPINDKSHDGKYHSRVTGTSQQLEGAATLSLPGQVLEFPACTGDISDVSVLETNPAFVSKNAGVNITCHWQTPDVSADFFAVEDQFGFASFTELQTADLNLSVFDTSGTTGSLTATSLTATIALVDEATGDPYSAQATATLTATGSPVNSTLLGADRPPEAHGAGSRAGRSARLLDRTVIRLRPGALPNCLVHQSDHRHEPVRPGAGREGSGKRRSERRPGREGRHEADGADKHDVGGR